MPRIAHVIGMTITEALPSLESTRAPEALKRVARDGGTYEIALVHCLNDRVNGDFEMLGFQTSENHGAVFFSDITEKHQAEETIRQLNAELEIESGSVRQTSNRRSLNSKRRTSSSTWRPARRATSSRQ